VPASGGFTDISVAHAYDDGADHNVDPGVTAAEWLERIRSSAAPAAMTPGAPAEPSFARAINSAQ